MALDPSNGYIAADGIADFPDTTAMALFDVQPVQLQFDVAADFVAGQVANNVIIIALSNGRILRIDLDKPEDIDGMASQLCSPNSPARQLIDTLLM